MLVQLQDCEEGIISVPEHIAEYSITIKYMFDCDGGILILPSLSDLISLVYLDLIFRNEICISNPLT